MTATRAGTALMLTSMFSVQLGLAASVRAASALGPLQVGWLRLAWAAVLLLVLVRPRPAMFARRALLACVALGAVTAGMTVLFMTAAARLPLSTASALEFLGPLAVAVFGGRSVRTPWPYLGAAGVVLLTEPWHGGADLVGVLAALAAAVCLAGYIVLTQRAGDAVTGIGALAVSMPVAALVATAAVLPAGVPHLDGPVVLLGLGLAVLVPVAPFVLELQALRRLTTAAFGTLMCLEPALALLIGFLVLHQIPPTAAFAGIACVVVAGVGAERSGARTTPPAAISLPA